MLKNHNRTIIAILQKWPENPLAEDLLEIQKGLAGS